MSILNVKIEGQTYYIEESGLIEWINKGYFEEVTNCVLEKTKGGICSFSRMEYILIIDASICLSELFYFDHFHFLILLEFIWFSWW